MSKYKIGDSFIYLGSNKYDRGQKLKIVNISKGVYIFKDHRYASIDWLDNNKDWMLERQSNSGNNNLQLPPGYTINESKYIPNSWRRVGDSLTIKFNSSNPITCSCNIIDVWNYGCKCGAFKAEMLKKGNTSG